MPYISNLPRREELVKDPFLARNVGEVNFVFSTLILNRWNANPNYSTLNLLRKIIRTTSIDSEIDNMFYQIPKNTELDQNDIRAALDNAWDEFYHRVGRSYEDTAIEKNGDLEGYKKAEQHIVEIYNEHKDRPTVAAVSTDSSKVV